MFSFALKADIKGSVYNGTIAGYYVSGSFSIEFSNNGIPLGSIEEHSDIRSTLYFIPNCEGFTIKRYDGNDSLISCTVVSIDETSIFFSDMF